MKVIKLYWALQIYLVGVKALSLNSMGKFLI